MCLHHTTYKPTSRSHAITIFLGLRATPNYWLALCDVATSYYYRWWLYYYGTNTPSSESKTIYKLSLWHAYANVPFITYNKSSIHNDNEDTCWIIDYFQQNILANTKVFITQQITSNEMNFNSTNPRHWKRLLWTIGALGRASYCQYREQRRTDHPGWSGIISGRILW